MNIALIIAGGSGQRTNQDIPKQFLSINDKPLIIYTLEAFQFHRAIDSILIVCIEGWREAMGAFARQFNITKLRTIVAGGKTRHESVKAGIDALEIMNVTIKEDDILLIHDANRPLVSVETIDDCLESVKEYGACVPVLPCYDWMLLTEDGKTSTESVDKGKLVRAQSPEASTFGKIKWAYDRIELDNISNLSGLSSILIALGETIHLSKGSERLMKVTTAEDFELIKAVINTKTSSWLKM